MYLSFAIRILYVCTLPSSYFYAVMMGTTAGIIIWKYSLKAHALFGFGDKKPVQRPEDVVWEDVRKDIIQLIEMDLDDDVEPFGPLFVRLAWHACGTYHQYHKVVQ